LGTAGDEARHPLKTAVILVPLLVALVLVIRWAFRRSLVPESLFRVSVTDREIVATDPAGEERRVAWSGLTRVEIRTTDKGPWEPDVFLVFYAHSVTPSLVLPQGATGDDRLLEALGTRLPGFRSDVVIKAMGSTSGRVFVVWDATAATSP